MITIDGSVSEKTLIRWFVAVSEEAKIGYKYSHQPIITEYLAKGENGRKA